MLRFGVNILSVISLIWAGGAYALGLTGTIKDGNGQPLAGVMVKVTSASAAAIVTKVFTDAKGEYIVPNLGRRVGINSVYVETFKLGYEQAQPQARALADLLPKISQDVAQVDFILKSVTNIATQISGSAWLALTPDSEEKKQTIVTCTQCHQLPNERVKRLSVGLANLDAAQRETVWRTMVGAMRTVMYGVLTAEHTKLMSPELIAEASKPENSLIDQRDEDIVATWLTKYMPSNFDNYDVANSALFAKVPLGVTKKTSIREFQYDEKKSSIRETAIVNGQYWLADMARNRIGTVDLKNGLYTWYDIPSPGAPVVHTMVPDSEGNIWVTLIGGTGDIAAVLNPKVETWRVYKGPKAIAAHDFSQGAGYRMEFDHNNIAWMTIFSHNKVLGFNRTTGEVTPFYDLPLPDWGGSHIHAIVYGGGMTSDKNFWFAQYNGNLGRFNTQSRKVDYIQHYKYGDGPHRMAVTDKDLIYLTLIGSGQISVIDAKQLKEIKRIDLPDLSSAPYTIAWDKRRNAMWIGTVNNDSLYKYDISSGTFTEYPVGIKDMHIRVISIDQTNGDLWMVNNPLPSNESEMCRAILYHPGDI